MSKLIIYDNLGPGDYCSNCTGGILGQVTPGADGVFFRLCAKCGTKKTVAGPKCASQGRFAATNGGRGDVCTPKNDHGLSSGLLAENDQKGGIAK